MFLFWHAVQNVHVLRIELNFVDIVAEIGQRMKKYDSI
jgi:hypothetical protein